MNLRSYITSYMVNPLQNVTAWITDRFQSLYDSAYNRLIKSRYRREKDMDIYDYYFLRIISSYRPALSAEDYEELIKKMMALPNKDARNVFCYYTSLTRATPTLSQNDQHHQASQLLRSCIMPVLKQYREQTNIRDEVRELITSMTKSDKSRPDLVSHFYLAKLSALVFGTEIADNYSKLREHMLSSLRDEKSILAFFFIPERIMRCFSAVRKKMADFESEIKVFLIAAMKKMRLYPERYQTQCNWIAANARIRFKKSMKDLTDDDIEKLSTDKNIRIGFAVVFAVENLTLITLSMLNNVFNDKSLLAKLQVEQKAFDQGDQKKMPLHRATVLESIRLGLCSSALTRYTDKEITIGKNEQKFTIPARTLIHLASGVLNDHAKKDQAYGFAPERFLDEKQQLNEFAKFKGYFLPFAAGARQCPAQGFALELLEKYLSALITEIKSCTYDSVELYPEDEKRSTVSQPR